MADLREEIKKIVHEQFGDEIEGYCAWDWEKARGRKPRYCLGCRITADAILHRITAPESEGGLGLKIMPRMLTGKMRARYEQAMMGHYRMVGSKDAAAMKVDPNDVAYFVYWDAAPPTPDQQ